LGYFSQICHVLYLIVNITALQHRNFHTYIYTTLNVKVVHFLRDWRWSSIVLEFRLFIGAVCQTDRCLVASVSEGQY